MKRKSVLSIAFVLLLIAMAALTFAFWDQLFTNDSGNIDVGVGKTIEITKTIVSGEGKRLVPVGALQGEHDVYHIEEEFTITFSEKLANDALNNYQLIVSLENVRTADEVDVDTYGLIIFEIAGKELRITDEVKTVSIPAEEINKVNLKITLENPKTEDEYNAIAGKTIKYTLSFEYQQFG
ncbi:MAG TPA: hypothetical protein GX740_01035 [Acholeplasmataceae bacterium]|nr:hypothetical protein [Acholeplasmataceae bacterium]